MSNDFISFDWAAKHMLRDKENFGILEGLISVLLDEKVTITEILESESNQASPDDKFNRVDIKARNSKGHIILVEVQLTRQANYLERLLYGVSKTIVEHIKLGESYDSVKKVYSISIVYCEMGKGDDYVYHGKTDFIGLHTGTQLQINSRDRKGLGMILPSQVLPEYYIIRVNKFNKKPENYLDEWVDYLQTGHVKEDSRAPGLPEVREKLRVLNMSEEERRAYEAHFDALRCRDDINYAYWYDGNIEGLTKGRAEGEALAQKKMAKKLHSLGMDSQFIEEATNLSPEEIKQILSEE